MKFKRERWKYLRVITSHETSTGAFRLADLRIAKVPNNYRRIDIGSALFAELFERYKARGKQTIGIREATRIIRAHDVTEALTRGESKEKKRIWGSPPYDPYVGGA